MRKSNNVSIVESRSCFGCSSCLNICKKKAISMQYNNYGVMQPVVDENTCNGCGLCLKICPTLSQRNLQIESVEKNLKAYAAIALGNDRSESASGGVFPELAKIFLEENGLICGCIVDNKCKVKHILTADVNDVRKMSDSKYVQSDMETCFSQIKDALNQNRPVLFSGTSCQVHGLLNYLTVKKIDSTRLLTVDLVCHGVPSPKVFEEYLKVYETETNSHVINFKFRSKKYGWGVIAENDYIQTVMTSKGNDDKSFLARMWMNIFFSDLTTRECCFSCPYATADKPADLTLADFWGIDSLLMDMNDKKGTSLILCHSKKGKNHIEKANLKLKEIQDIDSIIKLQSHLQRPSSRPDNYNSFWNDYNNKVPFLYLLTKYFKYTRLNKLKYYVKMKLYSLGLYRVASRLFTDLFY